MKNKQSAFSLVELSIVLVIIGLIVAGTLGGRELIAAAKLNAVIKELRTYDSAVVLFKEKYRYYPGDISSSLASRFGSSGGGNGDWLIGSTAVTAAESYRAFEHLMRAGLIEGQFTGVAGSGAKIGVNVPKSAYKDTATYYFYGNSSPLWSNYPRGNSLVLSGTSGNGWDDYKVAVKDAYNIDVKIDDAKPYTGYLVTYSHVDGDCVAAGNRLSTTPADLSAIAYLLSDSSDLCTVHYGLDGYRFVK